MKKPTISLEIKSFSNDSSIYGLRYLANSQRPWERTFWISFCVLSVVLSGLVVYSSMTDWQVTRFVFLSYFDLTHVEKSWYEIIRIAQGATISNSNFCRGICGITSYANLQSRSLL